MSLSDDIYAITKKFPSEERYGLISQMRSAAVSVASNIAEGSQRTSDKAFANFLLIAKGSLAELLTQALIAARCNFLSEQEKNTLCTAIDELSRMLHAFHAKLTARRS